MFLIYKILTLNDQTFVIYLATFQYQCFKGACGSGQDVLYCSIRAMIIKRYA